jgi:hypothetical protein
MQASELVAEISVNGYLEELVRVPEECAPSLMAYLARRGDQFPMALLVRIFVANWRGGVDLSLHNSFIEPTPG